MKICNKCGIEKEESEFHFTNDRIRRQPHCKKCHNIINRERNRITNYEYYKRPEVKLKLKLSDERIRPKRKEYFKDYNLNYNYEYPEKQMAHDASRGIKLMDGMVKHHWSYKEDHWKDIIELTYSQHMTVHKKMIYDREQMMYRRLDGVLLDNKKDHLEYINSLL